MENNNPKIKPIIDSIIAFSDDMNKDFLQRDKESKWSPDFWNHLGTLKIHGAFIPEKDGGLSLNHSEYATVLQALGHNIHDNGLNFSIMAHSLACLWPIFNYANSEELKKLIPQFANGKLILSNAMTEEHGGSDAFNMNTKAVLSGNEYILSGKKTFCANGPVATHALVYAETSPNKGFFGGITAFIVPLNLKGVKVGANIEKMGLRTAYASEINFDEVKVSNHFILGKAGNGGSIFSESMVYEKMYMSAAHTGTLNRWLNLMHKYSLQRKSGGLPIFKNQGVSHMLADVKISLESANAVVEKGVSLLANSDLATRISYAAIVKYITSNAMISSGQHYLNLFAAEGYKTSSGIELQIRDFMGSTIYSGTNNIQKNIIASAITH